MELFESSELDTQLDPRPPRRSGCKKSRALRRCASRVRPIRICRKGLGLNRSLPGQCRIRQLCRRVVVVVEQIIDLEGKLQPFGQVVMSSKIGDGIAW